MFLASTWPRMAEAPGWPGAGPLSYQLVILAAWASGGTARAPPRVRPSEMTRAWTLIAGMLTLTGTDRAGVRPEAWWRGGDPSLDSWRAPLAQAGGSGGGAQRSVS